MTKYKPTWALSLAGFSVLIGVWLVKYGVSFSQNWWFMALATSPLLIGGKRLCWIAIISIGLCLGLWRGGQVWQNLSAYQTQVGQKVTVSATVINDPVYANNSGQLEFYVGQANINGKKVPGKLRIRSYTASVLRSDVIEVSGTLRDGFGSYQAAMSYADVTIISRSQSPIEVFRREFIAKIYGILSEPQASLGLGFLIGVRSLLPGDLSDQLSVTGLTHIIAVSGYNLTILIQLCRRLFERFSRYMAVVTSCALMGSFLMITGNSPSIQRASVVSVLSLLAWYFGRQVSPIVLLSLSAAISAFLQPMFFWFDLGWHLSFLAFFGVLVLAPAIRRKLFADKQPKLIGSMMLETTSAQIMTAPLIAVVFSQVSVISLLANLVVLPLIPFAMLLTFIVGLVGFVWLDLAAVIAVPAEYILSFITSVVAILARIPWALSEATLTYNQVVVLLVSLAFILIGLRRSNLASKQRG